MIDFGVNSFDAILKNPLSPSSFTAASGVQLRGMIVALTPGAMRPHCHCSLIDFSAILIVALWLHCHCHFADLTLTFIRAIFSLR